MKINIAIDGPGAAGKSTIAKCLAKKLNYVHLDTGAMYRSTAYKALQNHICLEDEEAVCKMLEHTKIQLLIDGSILLDGQDVSDKIRTNEISLAASLYLSWPMYVVCLLHANKKWQKRRAYYGWP